MMSYRSADSYDEALLAEVKGARAFIFDLDGTLIDTVGLHIKSWIEACKAIGIRPPSYEELKGLMGLPAGDIARRLGGEKWRDVLRLKNEIYMELLDKEGVRVLDGAFDVLRLLKRMNVKTAIVTSSSRICALKAIRLSGLDKYTDVVITGDDVIRGKPSEEPFLKAIDLLGVGPGESVVVGDSPYDVEMGLRGGARLVFYITRGDCPFENRTICIAGLSELTRLLNAAYGLTT